MTRLDEVARHRGTVLRVHETVFASPADVLAAHRAGRVSPTAFRIASVAHLRWLWYRDRAASLTLLALAAGGDDLTLVND